MDRTPSTPSGVLKHGEVGDFPAMFEDAAPGTSRPRLNPEKIRQRNIGMSEIEYEFF